MTLLVREDLLEAAIGDGALVDHQVDIVLTDEANLFAVLQPEPEARKFAVLQRQVQPGRPRRRLPGHALRTLVQRQHRSGEAFARFMLQLLKERAGRHAGHHRHHGAIGRGTLLRLAVDHHGRQHAQLGAARLESDARQQGEREG